MTRYLFRRLLLMIPTLIGISLITFCIIKLAPGDPVALRAQGISGTIKSDQVAESIVMETRKRYGLDKPLMTQYGLWLKRIVTLDFGDSYIDHRPVLQKIGEALPITLLLNILSIFLIYLISVPIGLFSAMRSNGLFDRLMSLLLFILYSLPAFWVATLLIIYLGGGDYLDWFPVAGYISFGAGRLAWYQLIGNIAWHLVLPVLCLTYGGLAFMSRFSKAVVVDIVREDFMRTARAKGLSEWMTMWKHGVRNALIPMVTLMGSLLPSLLGGSVIIEQIFSIPGMGKLGFDAVIARDYPLIMALAVIGAVLTLIGLFISDLLYCAVDPRVTFEGKK